MAYFLKKSNYKKGTYLQIYESFYDPERKGGAHRSFKALGYVHELQAKGIDDPISFYKEEVIRLNQEANAAKAAKKAKQISDDSPEKLIGYFPMKNINDKLSVKKYMDLMQTATDFRFNVFDMISALVYARLVQPCSKSKTYDEVIPKLFESYDFSLNQLYDGWSISAANTKRSSKSTIIRSSRCIRLIPLILTLTALTFTLRSTGKMISGKKDLPRKTEKNRLLVWDSCLMQIRSPSA